MSEEEKIKVNDLSRLTKAELIKELEAMKAIEAERTKQIGLDMSFSETPEEKKTKAEKQAQKDFIKRMTGGKWVSEDKYQEFIAAQNKRMGVS